jgi:hypothetical protein
MRYMIFGKKELGSMGYSAQISSIFSPSCVIGAREIFTTPDRASVFH